MRSLCAWTCFFAVRPRTTTGTWYITYPPRHIYEYTVQWPHWRWLCVREEKEQDTRVTDRDFMRYEFRVERRDLDVTYRWKPAGRRFVRTIVTSIGVRSYLRVLTHIIVAGVVPELRLMWRTHTHTSVYRSITQGAAGCRLRPFACSGDDGLDPTVFSRSVWPKGNLKI